MAILGRNRTLSTLFLWWCFQYIPATEAGSVIYQNVYGEALQPCSFQGMALTGYTRSGYCVDEQDDQGSHHICIDLSTTVQTDDGDDNNSNFCQVTGQENWCEQEMACDTVNVAEAEEDADYAFQYDDDDAYCPIQNWCVCQWAFASYLDQSGGCDSIQEIVCESINLEAIIAYRSERASNNAKYQTALECLVNRCGLDWNQLPQSRSYAASTVSAKSMLALCFGFIVVVAAVACLMSRTDVEFVSTEEHGSYVLQKPQEATGIGKLVST